MNPLESKVVRCPFCVTKGEFRPMVESSEAFICTGCGHSAVPDNREFRCACRKCTELKEAPDSETLSHRAPMRCGIVEVSHVEDATGYSCGRDASHQCSDCSSTLCEVHVHHCSICLSTFCSTCLGFHEASAHPRKPSASEHEAPNQRRA
jgi:hypothetical protein